MIKIIYKKHKLTMYKVYTMVKRSGWSAEQPISVFYIKNFNF